MRLFAAGLAAIAGVAVFTLLAREQADPQIQIQQAQQALRGEHKDEAKAKRILLDLVAAQTRDPEALTMAYVYLGYIADRAGDRAGALGWFNKALAVEGASAGILDLARFGLERPVTWIRHLDLPEGAAPAAPPTVAPRIAKAYVTTDPPAFPPRRNLSATERRENFLALWGLIDTTYADFELKRIDWNEVKKRYAPRVETATSDDDFYTLMFQLVNELKDTHSWLNNYRVPALTVSPDVTLEAFGGKPFVVAVRAGSAAARAGVAPGWEIVAVDGLGVKEKIAALRPSLRACSSERAFTHGAIRGLLGGDSGTVAHVEFRAPDGAAHTVELARQGGPSAKPPVRTPGFALTRQRFVHYGRHPSGVGYIWIESFNDKSTIATEFDRALEALRDTPALILDIRDNPGGFGQPQILGRLLTKHALVGITYVKSGSGHRALTRHESTAEPGGPWQYRKPIALLVNDGTGSAADLFACELRSAQRVTTVGSTTHGNLAGVAAFIVIPCGLVVRVSNGYVCDAKLRPIEVNGNVPDIAIEPTVQDYLSGKDPVLERAVSVLLQ